MASPIVTNTSAQLNGGSLVVGFKTSLTDAQIKALPTTPITLVAAPGAGFRLKVVGAGAVLNNNAGGYTNINTTYCAAFQITYTDGSGPWQAVAAYINDTTLATALADATNNLGGTGIRVVDYSVPGYLTGVDAGAASGSTEWVLTHNYPLLSACENKALVVSIDNNGSGVLTGGNSANTYVVTVYVAYEAVS